MISFLGSPTLALGLVLLAVLAPTPAWSYGENPYTCYDYSPQAPSKIIPRIKLYALDKEEQILDYNDEGIRQFVKRNIDYLQVDRLIIMTHGFENTINEQWLADMNNTLLNATREHKLSQATMLLGWGHGAYTGILTFSQVAVNAQTVGEYLADVVIEIKRQVPSLQIYGVGHSFGSHVMGFAGRTSRLFDRITALDPAGPCYEGVPKGKGLRATDAKMVDAIHSDGMHDNRELAASFDLGTSHFGSLLPLGTIDFYPNFGHHQKSLPGQHYNGYNHGVSKDYYIWSIKNKGVFVTDEVLDGQLAMARPVYATKKVKLQVEMGYWADQWEQPAPREESNYYIETNAQEPWYPVVESTANAETTTARGYNLARLL